jgi:hypothetical protein
MNAGVQNLVVSLGLMQVARKIPFEDPQVVLYVRIAYVAVQVIALGVYYYISATVKKQNDLTVIKYVEPPNALSGEPGELVTVTVRDYDLTETSKLLRTVYLGISMMGFLHLYLGYTQPLFIQTVMGLKNLYDAKPVAIFVLGQPAVGDLQRPFKPAPGLFGATPGPQTDSAAIAEAEKRVGSKKEE